MCLAGYRDWYIGKEQGHMTRWWRKKKADVFILSLIYISESEAAFEVLKENFVARLIHSVSNQF